MNLSRSQIDHMRREEEVEHGGIRLPSLKRKCSELGLRQDGTSVVLATHCAGIAPAVMTSDDSAGNV